MITAVSLVICCHTNLLHTIIDCIPYAVLYIAMTDLFCDWKFIPFNLPRFLLLSHPPPLWQPTSLICESVAVLFCALDSTYRRNQSVCLTYLT